MCVTISSKLGLDLLALERVNQVKCFHLQREFVCWYLFDRLNTHIHSFTRTQTNKLSQPGTEHTRHAHINAYIYTYWAGPRKRKQFRRERKCYCGGCMYNLLNFVWYPVSWFWRAPYAPCVVLRVNERSVVWFSLYNNNNNSNNNNINNCNKNYNDKITSSRKFTESTYHKYLLVYITIVIPRAALAHVATIAPKIFSRQHKHDLNIFHP